MPASGPDGTQREVADRPPGAVGDQPRTGGGERRFFPYISVLIEFLNDGGGLREAMSRRVARECLPENEREAYAPKSLERRGGRGRLSGWAWRVQLGEAFLKTRDYLLLLVPGRGFGAAGSVVTGRAGWSAAPRNSCPAEPDPVLRSSR